MYKGSLILEDLSDLSVMKYLEIEKTEIIHFDNEVGVKNKIVYTSRYIDFPFILSGCMKSNFRNGKPCFFELDETNIHFVVLKGNVFSFNKGNRQEKEQILRKCQELGIELEDEL